MLLPGVAIVLVMLVLAVAARLLTSRPKRAADRKTSSAARPGLPDTDAGPAGPPLRRSVAPIGPDDDAEFLELISRRIRGISDSSE
jgi:hypothetical protein